MKCDSHAFLASLVLALLVGGFVVGHAEADERPVSLGPKAGDLYREFSIHAGGDRDWRVTDKKAVDKFPRAADHLPNSRLELSIDDLQHAIRAEAMLDRWGGHRGTINKRIRFNDRDWIVVPEIQAVPADIRPEQLMYQDNPVVAVPLDQLHEGINVLEGGCDEAGGFGWGQWGLYSLTLRVYYDAEAKGEKFVMTGRITEPAEGDTIGDDPLVSVDAEAAMGVARIDVLASYDGFDEDGDGVFDGYHESHFQLVSGQPNEIRDHVGTLWQQPYSLNWDTHFVPDQPARGIAMIARIQDSRGYWTVTPPVENLTLARDGISVKLYRAIGVPEDFSVRVEETKTCTFEIPAGDAIENATEAALHLRTWHGWDGHHEPLRINDHALPIAGKNHFYDYDVLAFPPSVLHRGTNTFAMHSKTEHHMLEVLWPGPAIVVRGPKTLVSENDQDGPTISEARYEDRDHFLIKTNGGEYWLDKNSGGLSRMIDRDGQDWIMFRKEPWDEYPASAASAFRGLPNLLFGSAEAGFGHPGWDRGISTQVNDHTIQCVSDSGDWTLRWTFFDQHVDLQVSTRDKETKFWFLYEGPIAGSWRPSNQYFASDVREPVTTPADYFKGERIVDTMRWAYFGDDSVDRVLYVIHNETDDGADQFSFLGNTPDGLDSPDGMVVFGFGRGPDGIDPLLQGDQSFRIGFMESPGKTNAQYEALRSQLQSFLPPTSTTK